MYVMTQAEAAAGLDMAGHTIKTQLVLVFFFSSRRRHTRFDCDWSSDVCFRSSGLIVKFNLIDKIESLTDDRIVAAKHVSLAEEYLADHFPTFPVLPGVLMLEALTQAAGWLLHHRRNFACSMAILREARNVKYGHVVE